MTLVSEQLRETFQADGAVKIANVFDAAHLELLERGIAEAMTGRGRYTRRQSDPDDPGYFFSDYWASDRVESLLRFVRESPAGEVAASIMGSSRARFFFDAVWVKEPGTRKVSAWHQDQPYYCVDGGQICIIWIPVDPIPASVSLQCVRGSHAWGRAFAPIHFTDGSGFGRGDGRSTFPGYEPMPDIDSAPHEYQRLSWDFARGDCLVFHGMTIHGAPGNLGSSRRRVLALTFLGDDVTYLKRPGEMEPHRPHFDQLADGAPLPENDFPTVWQRSSSS